MKKILSIKDLSIRIQDRVLMENVSFDVNSGDIILLSGANGVGKSTLLKSILGLETKGKNIKGEIIYADYGNVLELNQDELQKVRSRIAYVQQKDEYSEMGNVLVGEIIRDCSESFSGNAIRIKDINDLIDEWIPRRDNNKRVFDAKSKPEKFSGGEQRLLSVFSTVVTRLNTNLIIIDEPLNNLDFTNARIISNLLNKVIKDNPEVAMIMVSHCKIFPFFTKEINITSKGVFEIDNNVTCYSCFGEPDSEGFY